MDGMTREIMFGPRGYANPVSRKLDTKWAPWKQKVGQVKSTLNTPVINTNFIVGMNDFQVDLLHR